MTIDIETVLNFYYNFYQIHGVKIPRYFAKIFRDLWEANSSQIIESVKKEGYDFLLLGLPIRSVSEFDQKMTGTDKPTKFWLDPAKIKENELVLKPRLVLMYREPNLMNHPILQATLREPAQYFRNQGIKTTFSDYIVYRKVVWEQDKVRAETSGSVCLPGSMIDSLVICSYWHPENQLEVYADSDDSPHPTRGCRLSCCFDKRV